MPVMTYTHPSNTMVLEHVYALQYSSSIWFTKLFAQRLPKHGGGTAYVGILLRHTGID